MGTLVSVRLAHACGDLRITLALWSTAAVSLYFGHIECYTVPAVALLFYALESRRVIDDPTRISPALAWFTVAAAFHMQILCLAPTAVAITLHAAKHGHRPRAARAVLASLVCLAAVQLVCALLPPPYPQFYGGGVMLVSITRFFTTAHARDIINTVTLYVPATPLALTLAVIARPRAVVQNPWHLWLTLAFVTWLAFCFLWNADLGTRRDRDRFAFGGFVGALTAAQLACDFVHPSA